MGCGPSKATPADETTSRVSQGRAKPPLPARGTAGKANPSAASDAALSAVQKDSASTIHSATDTAGATSRYLALSGHTL